MPGRRLAQAVPQLQHLRAAGDGARVRAAGGSHGRAHRADHREVPHRDPQAGPLRQQRDRPERGLQALQVLPPLPRRIKFYLEEQLLVEQLSESNLLDSLAKSYENSV